MGSKPTPPNSLVFVGQTEACNIAKLLRPAKLLRATPAWHEQRSDQIEKKRRKVDGTADQMMVHRAARAVVVEMVF